MTRAQLVVNEQTQNDEIDDDRRRHEPMAQPGAGEAFRAAVILGHGLQDNAPPEIPVDLDVPFVPTGIGGIAPVLFIEQAKDRAEEMMAILPLLAPIAAMA